MGTYSEYYQNYRGPRLTSAMMYQQDKQIDITDITSDTTNYIFIECAQASGEEVYGGYITIAIA